MPLFDFDLIKALSAPPDPKKAEGRTVKRVSKVVQYWNAEAQRWEFEEPKGIVDILGPAKKREGTY